MGPPGQLVTPGGVAATIISGTVATASTDGNRLVTGSNRACPTPCIVADGPFVLTDARVMDQGHSSWFYSVPATADCTMTCNFNIGPLVPAGADVDVLVGLSAVRSETGAPTFVFDLPRDLSGGRYFLPAGRRLCLCAGNFTVGSALPWRVSWAGFVPYQ